MRDLLRGQTARAEILSWWMRLGKALLVLVVAWGGFLYLVRAEPVDPANALIMVWLSALVMILACLPEIFALFKRFKWGDVELELRDTLRDAESDLRTIENLENPSIFTLKKGLAELANLVSRVAARPETPVLMKIELGHGDVSWAVLYTHVLVLETLGAPVRLLFLDSGERRASSEPRRLHPNHVPVSVVLGVLSGRRFLILCQSRWPALKNLLLFARHRRPTHHDIPRLKLGSRELEMLCDHVREVMENDSQVQEQLGFRLDCSQFHQWLADEVDRLVIDVELSSRDLAVIEKALRQQRRFLIVARDGELHSVLSVCTVTRQVALEALGRPAGSATSRDD